MTNNAWEIPSAIEAGALFAAVRLSREAPPNSEARIRAVIVPVNEERCLTDGA